MRRLQRQRRLIGRQHLGQLPGDDPGQKRHEGDEHPSPGPDRTQPKPGQDKAGYDARGKVGPAAFATHARTAPNRRSRAP